MIIIGIISILVLVGAKLFPGFYLSELILSFSPYIMGLCIFAIALSFILFRKSRKVLKKWGYIILLLLFAILFSIYGKDCSNFYTNVGFPYINTPNKVNTGQGLDIFYANILRTNDEYQDIITTIQQKDPDIIMLIEFADHHKDYFYEAFNETYPYNNIVQRSTRFFGSIVFSKYPLEKIELNIPVGLRRYNYFKIDYQNRDYYFYLLHTSSPTTYKYFGLRNRQLGRIPSDMKEHGNLRNTEDRIILLGDLNISPWSIYYKRFIYALGDDFINITAQKNIMFTWKFGYLPFMKVHIDHILVNENVSIENLENLKLPGSDHRALFIEGLK